MVSIETLKKRYDAAKRAKTGDKIVCPWCGKTHAKTTYHKVFCSNQKTKGRRNCKDMFWNNVDPEKRCRHTDYFYDVILPEREKDEAHFADDDGSWDAHQAYVEKCEFCNEWPANCRCGE